MNILIRCYALFVVLWFVANRLIQDIWWPLVVLDKFAEYFLFAALPVFLLSLFFQTLSFQRKATPLLAALPVLVAGYFYVPLLKPANPQALSVDSTVLSIGTYNIWNHNKNLIGVVDTINASKADVVALQEITDVQQADLVERLRLSYPFYHVSKPVYGGTTALFSKYELSNIKEIDFNIDRPAIYAEVKLNSATIGVVSAHLNPSYWAYHDQALLEIPENYHQYIKDQNKQAQMIMDELIKRPYLNGAVLACDCNSQETASTNRLLRNYFQDSFRAYGFKWGKSIRSAFNYERKLSHIDYIWFSGDLVPIGVYRARESAGSDHPLVFAEFRLQE